MGSSFWVSLGRVHTWLREDLPALTYACSEEGLRGQGTTHL